MPDIKKKLVEIEKAAEWFENRAKNTPMPGSRKMFELAGEVLREKANGVTIQRWISVEERMPEYGEKVLVCDIREDYVGVSVLQKGFDFGGEKDPDYWCWSDDCFNLDEFTHWMWCVWSCGCSSLRKLNSTERGCRGWRTCGMNTVPNAESGI